jgi:hypothetical protein
MKTKARAKPVGVRAAVAGGVGEVLFEIKHVTSSIGNLQVEAIEWIGDSLDTGAKSKPARLKGTSMRHPETFSALRLRHPNKIQSLCAPARLSMRIMRE